MKNFKKSCFFIWVVLCSFLSSIGATDIFFTVGDLPETFPSSTNPLWGFQDQQVEVRGFWYGQTATQGILASSPNLKSCCVGKPSKVSQQLVVRGDLPSIPDHQAVSVTGIFKIEPLYDTLGQLTQLYVLEQPQEMQKKSHYGDYLFLIGALCLAVGYFYKRKPSKHRQ